MYVLIFPLGISCLTGLSRFSFQSFASRERKSFPVYPPAIVTPAPMLGRSFPATACFGKSVAGVTVGVSAGVPDGVAAAFGAAAVGRSDAAVFSGALRLQETAPAAPMATAISTTGTRRAVRITGLRR